MRRENAKTNVATLTTDSGEPDAPQPPKDPDAEDFPITRRTKAELEEIGALDTSQGQMLLALARRADSGWETGSGLASISRQMTTVMEAIRVEHQKPEVDPVDELRALRDRKRGIAS